MTDINYRVVYMFANKLFHYIYLLLCIHVLSAVYHESMRNVASAPRLNNWYKLGFTLIMIDLQWLA